MAVLIGLFEVAFKYQILFDPPVALKLINLPGQISWGVPAFAGASGFSNACANVPLDKGLSHPALTHEANNRLASGFVKLISNRAPVPMGFFCSSYHCVR